jgi:hypothetical protein
MPDCGVAAYHHPCHWHFLAHSASDAAKPTCHDVCSETHGYRLFTQEYQYSSVLLCTQPTPQIWVVLLQKLTLKKFPLSTEPNGLLICSQQPATGPYPEPDESRSHPHNLSQSISILISSSQSCPCLSSGLFPFSYPTKTVYALLPHNCYMWRRIQVMKLLIMLLFPASCYCPSTLCSWTPSVCGLLLMWVSHIYVSITQLSGYDVLTCHVLLCVVVGMMSLHVYIYMSCQPAMQICKFN